MLLTTGSDNTFVGYTSGPSGTGISSAVAVGSTTTAHTGSIVLGNGAASTGNNQFVVGSSTTNAGTIDTAVVTPTQRWKVKINGVDYYIALQPV